MSRDILLFGIPFFWLFIVTFKILYYGYILQVKAYRFDRIWGKLKEPGGFALFFNRSFYIKVTLAIVLTFLGALAPFLFLILVFLYGGEFLLIVYRGFKNQIKFPIITFKSVVMFLLSFFTPFVLFLSVSFSTQEDFFVYLLKLDILAPLFVMFWVLAFKPLTYIGKQYIVFLAKRKREKLKTLRAIAITGSFGKTSTKEFLATILESKFIVAKTQNHQNTEIGAARAILSMHENTEVLVVEEAAYKRGDIAEISAVVKPTIGIITAIGSQHLALFGSQEAIIETKFELAKALPEHGTLIVNGDDENVKRKVKRVKQRRIVTYSLDDNNADIYASDIEETLKDVSFTAHAKDAKETMRASLLGRHNVSNLLGAIAAALSLGMDFAEIANAIKAIKPFPRTLEPKKGIKDTLIIDDTYNASFEGVLAALHVLTIARGKKIVILTSLIELGKKAHEVHETIGKALALSCDLAIVTDTKYRKELKNTRTLFMSDPAEVIEKVTRELTDDTTILLEGRIPQVIVNALCKS